MKRLNVLKPTKVDVLIYDSLGINYLRRSIPNNITNYLIDLRDQVPVVLSWKFFLDWIIQLKKTRLKILESYFIALIDQYQPRIVISFSDRSSFLGKYAKIRPNVYVVAVQNALRYPNVLHKVHRLPVYYSLGKATIEAINMLDIPCQRSVSSGSFPLGIYLLDNPTIQQSRTIVFVSSYRASFDKTNHNDPYELGLAQAHKTVFLHLLRYSKALNIDITVVMKGKVRYEGEHFAKEKAYFNNLSQGYSINLSSAVKDSFRSYEVVLSADIVVAIDSTLAYEALSIGKKILLGWGIEKSLFEKSHYFLSMLPKDITLFNQDYDHFREKLDNLRVLKDDNYESAIKTCRSHYVSQDIRCPPHIRLRKEIQEKTVVY